jgi:hypothetical protein
MRVVLIAVMTCLTRGAASSAVCIVQPHGITVTNALSADGAQVADLHDVPFAVMVHAGELHPAVGRQMSTSRRVLEQMPWAAILAGWLMQHCIDTIWIVQNRLATLQEVSLHFGSS